MNFYFIFHTTDYSKFLIRSLVLAFSTIRSKTQSEFELQELYAPCTPSPYPHPLCPKGVLTESGTKGRSANSLSQGGIEIEMTEKRASKKHIIEASRFR